MGYQGAKALIKLAMRLRLLEVVALKGMTDFVFYAAMPSLLFLSIGGAPPLRLADVALSFGAGVACMMWFELLKISRRRKALRAEEALQVAPAVVR